jgi:hypothetical protein
MAKENYPSGYYICCWRMFRARRLANQFHISEQTVATFETGKCLLFVVLLVIIKFIVLNSQRSTLRNKIQKSCRGCSRWTKMHSLNLCCVSSTWLLSDLHLSANLS